MRRIHFDYDVQSIVAITKVLDAEFNGKGYTYNYERGDDLPASVDVTDDAVYAAIDTDDLKVEVL